MWNAYTSWKETLKARTKMNLLWLNFAVYAKKLEKGKQFAENNLLAEKLDKIAITEGQLFTRVEIPPIYYFVQWSLAEVKCKNWRLNLFAVSMVEKLYILIISHLLHFVQTACQVAYNLAFSYSLSKSTICGRGVHLCKGSYLPQDRKKNIHIINS